MPNVQPKLFHVSRVVRWITLVAYILFPVAILSWFKLFFIIIIFGVFLIGFKYLFKFNLNVNQTQTLPFICFFIAAVISITWSKYFSNSIFDLLVLSPFFFLFYLTFEAIKSQGDRFIFKIVAWVPIFIGAISCWMLFEYGTLRPKAYADILASGQNIGSFANEASAIVEACYPILVYFFVQGRRRLLVIIGLISSFFIVVASESRGALLGLVVFIFMSIWLVNINREIRIKLLSLLLMVAILLILLFLFFNSYGYFEFLLDRISNSQLWNLSEPDSNMDDYVRAVMMFEGVNSILEHPFLGLGIGGLAGRIENTYGITVVSHNIILTAWGEMGILGLIAFIWMTMTAIRRLTKLRSYYKFCNQNYYLLYTFSIISFVMILIHGFFRPLLTNPMFYFVLALAYTKPPTLSMLKR